MPFKIHELKTVQPYFFDVFLDKKKFEVRYNDRKFEKDDLLLLREFNPILLEYTGREILCEVTYLLDDSKYCKKGYVIMGIKILRKRG